MVSSGVDVVEAGPVQPGGVLAASKLRWSAIFGGTFTALGIWLLLGAFGLAIGLTAVSPEDPDLRKVLIWLGIWSLIVPVIALFIGSFVTARSTVVAERPTGLLYGAVVWGLTTFIWATFAWSFASGLVGRTLSTAGQLASGLGQATASAVTAAAGPEGTQAVQSVAGWLNVDRRTLLDPLNQRLRARGIEPVTAPQLQAALQDAAREAIRQGQLDQDIMVNALTRHTRMNREEAQSLANQLVSQWQQTVGKVSGQLQQAAETARVGAMKALDITGKALWFIFGSTLLGLCASLAAGWMVPGRFSRVPPTERVVTPRLEEAPAGA